MASARLRKRYAFSESDFGSHRRRRRFIGIDSSGPTTLAVLWIPSAARRFGIPAAPAHTDETLQVGCDRPPASPLVRSDASLGFRDLSIQDGDGFLRLIARSRVIAGPEAGDFQGLDGSTVLFELNPVPGDVAVAVGNHERRPFLRANVNALKVICLG